VRCSTPLLSPLAPSTPSTLCHLPPSILPLSPSLFQMHAGIVCPVRSLCDAGSLFVRLASHQQHDITMFQAYPIISCLRLCVLVASGPGRAQRSAMSRAGRLPAGLREGLRAGDPGLAFIFLNCFFLFPFLRSVSQQKWRD